MLDQKIKDYLIFGKVDVAFFASGHFGVSHGAEGGGGSGSSGLLLVQLKELQLIEQKRCFLSNCPLDILLKDCRRQFHLIFITNSIVDMYAENTDRE